MTPITTLERIILFVCVSLVTFMMVLDYSIANIAIPYISGDLAVSNEQGTYVITSFAVGNAIGLILTGWLTKRVGQIRLIVISTGLFTLMSASCGFSSSLAMLVVNRFLQGLVSGPIVPLSQSLLLSYGTKESHARDLAFWSTIVITAPVVGPILGGYISDYYSWSWIFYINIPFGLACTIIFWVMMKNRETPTDKTPADYAGILLLSIGVTALQIFLDKGQNWDWWNSHLIQILASSTVIAFTYLFIQEYWHKTPFIALRLFKIPSFTLAMLCLFVSYGIYFGTVVLVPLWLQEYMNYSAEKAGLAVAALGIAPTLLSFTTPLFVKWIGNAATLAISFAFFALACFCSAFFTTDVSLGVISGARFLFGFGFVYYISPLFGLSTQDIDPKDLPMAMGIFHFCRSMVGGIGTSVFTTLWIRRTYFHHERIGELLTRFNPITPEVADLQSLALLNQVLDQQAAMLAMNEVFYLMGWIFCALLAVLGTWLVLTKKQSPQKSLLDNSSSA